MSVSSWNSNSLLKHFASVAAHRISPSAPTNSLFRIMYALSFINTHLCGAQIMYIGVQSPNWIDWPRKTLNLNVYCLVLSAISNWMISTTANDDVCDVMSSLLCLIGNCSSLSLPPPPSPPPWSDWVTVEVGSLCSFLFCCSPFPVLPGEILRDISYSGSYADNPSSSIRRETLKQKSSIRQRLVQPDTDRQSVQPRQLQHHCSRGVFHYKKVFKKNVFNFPLDSITIEPHQHNDIF